jgi:hypothetical protein
MILTLYKDAASIGCHVASNGKLYNDKEWKGGKTHITLRSHGTPMISQYGLDL